MEDERQIVAVGGVSRESAPALYRYLLDQCATPTPRVGFLPTANADSDSSLVRFYAGFSGLTCRPSHLKLFGRVSSPEQFVRDQDLILVGGGNTKSMLGLWREWGLDASLRDAWNRGTLLAGFSAGAICWFAEAVCDSWADRLVAIPALGMLPGSCCPHYDGEAERRPAFQEMLRAGEVSAGIAIDDDCAVHFRGVAPSAVLRLRPDAGAYAVAVREGSIEETALDVPTIRAS